MGFLDALWDFLDALWDFLDALWDWLKWSYSHYTFMLPHAYQKYKMLKNALTVILKVKDRVL